LPEQGHLRAAQRRRHGASQRLDERSGAGGRGLCIRGGGRLDREEDCSDDLQQGGMSVTKPGDRGYKRSWKNLLINKRYQLRFTLFMVGLSALLMVGLGAWVMWVADETTAVSITSLRGDACPKLPAVTASSAEDELPAPSMKLDEPDGAGAAPDPGSAAPVEN